MGLLGDVAGAVGGIVGGIMGNNSAADTAQKNYEAQKEFAQNGIRWKVADAKAAGIHPLAALGVNNASFSPSFTAGDYSWLGDAGQNLGRAIESKATRAERELGKAMQAETHAEQIRGLKLENDIRAETLLQMKENSLTALKRNNAPVMPSLNANGTVISGQGDSAVDGPNPKFQWVRNHNGKLELYPSGDYAQLWEDKPLGSDLLPILESGYESLKGKITGAPVGGMVWDSTVGDWVPVNSRSGRDTLKRTTPTKESTKRAYKHRFWR